MFPKGVKIEKIDNQNETPASSLKFEIRSLASTIKQNNKSILNSSKHFRHFLSLNLETPYKGR